MQEPMMMQSSESSESSCMHALKWGWCEQHGGADRRVGKAVVEEISSRSRRKEDECCT